MRNSVWFHFRTKLPEIFLPYSSANHHLVHNKARAEISKDELKKSVIDESRIAGAINILLIKLIGYMRHMRHSTFEDGHREI